MPGKEPNPDTKPYKPGKPGGKPWPGYPKPMPPGKDWPVKKAKHENRPKPHDQSVNA